jgi:fatty-acyl-CoA synthase
MIRGFQERHGLRVLHAWGMTEMAPLGTVSQLPSDLLDAPALRSRVITALEEGS